MTSIARLRAVLNQAQLLITAEFLDGSFAPVGAAAGMTVFAVNHFLGLAAIEVLRTAWMVQVFLKAPLQFGGDAGIEGAIVTTDDVDRPAHGDNSLKSIMVVRLAFKY